MEAESFYET